MAKGLFTPKNPQKYIGDVLRIRFMSSWELQVMHMFDTNPSFLEWASEEIKIPYLKPTTNRVHYYYPDFYVCYRDREGHINKELIRSSR